MGNSIRPEAAIDAPLVAAAYSALGIPSNLQHLADPNQVFLEHARRLGLHTDDVAYIRSLKLERMPGGEMRMMKAGLDIASLALTAWEQVGMLTGLASGAGGATGGLSVSSVLPAFMTYTSTATGTSVVSAVQGGASAGMGASGAASGGALAAAGAALSFFAVFVAIAMIAVQFAEAAERRRRERAVARAKEASIIFNDIGKRLDNVDNGIEALAFFRQPFIAGTTVMTGAVLRMLTEEVIAGKHLTPGTGTGILWEPDLDSAVVALFLRELRYPMQNLSGLQWVNNPTEMIIATGVENGGDGRDRWRQIIAGLAKIARAFDASIDQRAAGLIPDRVTLDWMWVECYMGQRVTRTPEWLQGQLNDRHSWLYELYTTPPAQSGLFGAALKRLSQAYGIMPALNVAPVQYAPAPFVDTATGVVRDPYEGAPHVGGQVAEFDAAAMQYFAQHPDVAADYNYGQHKGLMMAWRHYVDWGRAAGYVWPGAPPPVQIDPYQQQDGGNWMQFAGLGAWGW